MKPKKILYQDQEKIRKEILTEIKEKKLQTITEAYLIGSLAEGTFGIYEQEYEGQTGSDIDIVALPLTIPPTWKNEGEGYGWHTRYRGDIIRVENNEHHINVMVPFQNNIGLFWKIAKELEWRCIKLQ